MLILGGQTPAASRRPSPLARRFPGVDVTSQEAPAPFCRWFNYVKSQGYEPIAGRVLTTPPRGPRRGAEVSSPDRGSGRGDGSPKTS